MPRQIPQDRSSRWTSRIGLVDWRRGESVVVVLSHRCVPYRPGLRPQLTNGAVLLLLPVPACIRSSNQHLQFSRDHLILQNLSSLLGPRSVRGEVGIMVNVYRAHATTHHPCSVMKDSLRMQHGCRTSRIQRAPIDHRFRSFEIDSHETLIQISCLTTHAKPRCGLMRIVCAYSGRI